MPELKNLFIKGKMNKDLDERLVPQGEYRDAQNIDVAFSEGSNVGAIEPIMGHTTQSGFFYNLTDAHCVGSVTDTETDKAYALVYSPSINIIVEYDIIANTKQIVLADEGTILNFSPERLVTGISVLDGVLYYTDNHTEPKQIDIEYWKSKSNLTAIVASGASGQNTVTLTTDISTALSALIADGDVYFFGIGGIPQNVRAVSVSGTTVTLSANLTTIGAVANTTAIFSILYTTGNLSEDRITLIRKSPLNAPIFNTLAQTQRGGNGTYGNTDIITEEINIFSTNIDDELQDILISTDGTASGSSPNYALNDILIFSYEYINIFGELEESTAEFQITGIDLQNNSFDITLITKNPGIVNDSVSYKTVLKEENPLFEYSFPKFAYRYKYKNNQYSLISPFSYPAFIPGDFKYNAIDGYNLGMTNNARKIELKGWGNEDNFGTISANKITLSSNSYAADIKEIEILYKNTNSTNIYIADTIKADANGKFDEIIEIKDEQIFKAIQSNQILRSFDNIPKKAKALEITGNRLIFGNYLQNFDFPFNLDFDTANTKIITRSSSNYGFGSSEKLSLKSLRNYQIGVVFLDDYNRQTPVFTNKNGILKNSIDNSNLNTSINAKLSITNLGNDSLSDLGLTKYRYFIKETSNEYYNLPLSNSYLDEDKNFIYLSFPSSEVNKLNENDYLIIKKAPDGTPYKNLNNKFKVLGVSSEAPNFLTQKNTVTYTAEKIVFSRSFSDGGAIDQDANMTADIKYRTPGRSPVTGYSTFLLLRAQPVGSNGYEVHADVEALLIPGAKIRFVRGNKKSEVYEILTATMADDGSDEDFEIIVSKPFGKDIEIIYTSSEHNSEYSGVSMEFITQEEIDTVSAKFKNKFFVKLNANKFLLNVLTSNVSVQDLKILDTQYLGRYTPSATNYPNAALGGGVANNNLEKERLWMFNTEDGNQNSYTVEIKTFYSYTHAESQYNTSVFDSSLQVGNFIRFGDRPLSIQNAYSATETEHNLGDLAEIYKITNIQTTITSETHYNITYSRKKYNLTLDKPLKVDVSGAFDDSDGTVIIPKAKVDIFTLDDLKDSYFNPVIFETEPEEGVLDIYYESNKTYNTSDLESSSYSGDEIFFANCYSFNNGVESDRIRDDYNAIVLGKGEKVSSVFEETYEEERIKSGLIFSGIYNGKNGINRLNQFIIAENITEEANPIYGSIQKLNTRDTDLTLLCDDKILKVPARKDLLFQADGNPQVTSTDRFLGTIIPYQGNYGCQHPESFANYTYKSYFVDKTRGKVLRLSLDGITEISNYGMRDFFSDICYSHSGYIHGSFDNYKNQYNVSFRVTPNSLDESVVDKTITFSESVNGWVSFKDYIQESGFSLNNRYVTFKDGDAYRHHNSGSSGLHGPAYKSSVTLLLNGNPGSIKNFRTLNYQGQDGWEADTITTDKQTGNISSFIEKEGIYYNYISGETQNTKASLDLKSLNVQGLGTPTNISSNDATFADLNNAIQVGDKVFNNNNSDVRTVQSISGNTITLDAAPTNAFSYFAKDNRFNTSGLLGYYAEIKMETKNNVNSGNRPELYSVGSEVSLSS